jgi:hypothetical protein
MERFEFDCIYDLARNMQITLGKIDEDCPVISAYGNYDVIKNLLEDLIMDGISIAHEIELEDFDVSHYDREFVLYLTTNGVSVEKVYRNDKYYRGSGDISYIHEKCNPELLDYIDTESTYKFAIAGEECHYCESTEKDLYLETIDGDDNNIVGFKVCEKTNEGYFGYSYYNSDGIDENGIHDVLRKIGMI